MGCQSSDLRLIIACHYYKWIILTLQLTIATGAIEKMKLRGSSALVLSLALILLCVAIPLKVFAHAVLLESRPATGTVVKGPVLPIWLRFNVRVDGSRSRCMLVLPDGNLKALPLDPQAKPDILTGKATELVAGNYKLQWQVLAADGHITRGELKLKVD